MRTARAKPLAAAPYIPCLSGRGVRTPASQYVFHTASWPGSARFKAGSLRSNNRQRVCPQDLAHGGSAAWVYIVG